MRCRRSRPENCYILLLPNLAFTASVKLEAETNNPTQEVRGYQHPASHSRSPLTQVTSRETRKPTCLELRSRPMEAGCRLPITERAPLQIADLSGVRGATGDRLLIHFDSIVRPAHNVFGSIQNHHLHRPNYGVTRQFDMFPST
ncbi:hypothetical protein BDV18DRAFT_97482 [Aspergillus unguis]